ncbi:hypothetical protein RCL1_007076 [Eukaryota sp. TZLM3-RCL]
MDLDVYDVLDISTCIQNGRFQLPAFDQHPTPTEVPPQRPNSPTSTSFTHNKTPESPSSDSLFLSDSDSFVDETEQIPPISVQVTSPSQPISSNISFLSEIHSELSELAQALAQKEKQLNLSNLLLQSTAKPKENVGKLKQTLGELSRDNSTMRSKIKNFELQFKDLQSKIHTLSLENARLLKKNKELESTTRPVKKKAQITKSRNPSNFSLNFSTIISILSNINFGTSVISLYSSESFLELINQIWINNSVLKTCELQEFLLFNLKFIFHASSNVFLLKSKIFDIIFSKNSERFLSGDQIFILITSVFLLSICISNSNFIQSSVKLFQQEIIHLLDSSEIVSFLVSNQIFSQILISFMTSKISEFQSISVNILYKISSDFSNLNNWLKLLDLNEFFSSCLLLVGQNSEFLVPVITISDRILSFCDLKLLSTTIVKSLLELFGKILDFNFPPTISSSLNSVVTILSNFVEEQK